MIIWKSSILWQYSLNNNSLFSQTKTIANIHCGIIVNVFSKYDCQQPKPLSMDSHIYDTYIKWSWKRIWVGSFCFSISIPFSIFINSIFSFPKGIDDIGNESEPMVELENKIRTQNEEYFEVHDYIDMEVPHVNQVKILTTNNQMVPAKGAQVSETYPIYI